MLGLIKDGFNKVFGIADKVIIDKDKKNELDTALKELEMTTNLEFQKILNDRANTPLGKCISMVFPMVAFAFVLTLVSNVFMHLWKFFHGETNELIPIASEMYQVMMIYLAGYFGSSTVAKWKNGGK